MGNNSGTSAPEITPSQPLEQVQSIGQSATDTLTIVCLRGRDQPPLFQGLLNPDGTITLLDPDRHAVGVGSFADHGRRLLVKRADGNVDAINLVGTTLETTSGTRTSVYIVGSTGALHLTSTTLRSDGALTIPDSGGHMTRVPQGAMVTFNDHGQVFVDGRLVLGQPTHRRSRGEQLRSLPGQAATTTSVTHDDPSVRLKDGRWVRLSVFLGMLSGLDSLGPNALSKLDSVAALYDPGPNDPQVTLQDGTVMPLSKYLVKTHQDLVDAGDPMITLKDNSQMRASDYFGRLEVDIEAINTLRDCMYSHSDGVVGVWQTLQSALAGVEAALGDNFKFIYPPFCGQHQLPLGAYADAWPAADQLLEFNSEYSGLQHGCLDAIWALGQNLWTVAEGLRTMVDGDGKNPGIWGVEQENERSLRAKDPFLTVRATYPTPAAPTSKVGGPT
jgi:hypothetical protein